MNSMKEIPSPSLTLCAPRNQVNLELLGGTFASCGDSLPGHEANSEDRKVKPRMEEGEGRELMSPFETTDSLCLEARVHSVLGLHIQFSIPVNTYTGYPGDSHTDEILPNAKVRKT